MDGAERMVALKRAYAEIILNTAKEAAARVIASERKALRFEEDLRCTKDESVRLLLRLKHMIQQKTTEAEKMSLRQQKRIEELEAQLQEAEGIIVDLREELKLVYDKLKKAKSYQLPHCSGGSPKDDASPAECVTDGGKLLSSSEPIVPYPSDSEIERSTNSETDAPLDNRNQICNGSSTKEQAKQTDASNLGQIYTQDSSLSSIITRNKEPKLYNNGCMQRIRAFERNRINRTLSNSDNIEIQYSELIVDADDKYEGNSPVPIKNKGMRIKNLVKLSLRKYKVHTRRRNFLSGNYKASSFRSYRDQLLRYFQRYPVTPIGGTYFINRSMKCKEDSEDGSACQSDELNLRKNLLGGQETLHHEGVSHQVNIQIIDKGKRKQNVRSRVGIFNLSNSSKSSFLFPCKYNSVSGNGYAGEDKQSVSKGDSEIRTMHRLNPGVTLIKPQADSGSANVTASINLIGKSRDVPTAEAKKTKDVPASVNQEEDDTEVSSFASFELTPNKVDISTNDALTTQAEVRGSPPYFKGSLSQASENRLLRYERKRKKECLSNPDEITDPKSTVKRRAGENDGHVLKPQKSNLINESSRESRRLAQVARQLIALSGKRWR